MTTPAPTAATAQVIVAANRSNDSAGTNDSRPRSPVLRSLRGPAPRVAVVGVMGCGVLAAFLLVPDRPGVSWFVVGLGVAAIAFASRRAGKASTAVGPIEATPPTTIDEAALDGVPGEGVPGEGVPTEAAPVREAAPPDAVPESDPVPDEDAATIVPVTAGERAQRVAWGAASLALLAVGAFRADGALYAWCVLTAIACASIGLAGGRTVRGLGLGAYAIVLAALQAPIWWIRGARTMRRGREESVRIARTVAICFGLIVVFGLLFASADRAFAHLMSFVVPSISGHGSGGRSSRC